MLTNKAKENFVKWLIANYPYVWDNILMMRKSFAQVIIIEWFDTVGLHISVEPNLGGGAVVFYSKVFYRHPENFVDAWCDVENEGFSPNIFYFSDRQSATKAAIEQATKIYNER